MIPILIPILSSAIPFLVKQAEGIFSHTPESGSDKHKWVIGALANIADDAKAHVPDWAKPSIEEIEAFAGPKIEEVLDRIDP